LRLLLIGALGAIGTLARYGLQGLVQIKMESTFPYGTLLINLTGCFFLGLIGQLLLNRVIVPPEWRMAIAVGFFRRVHYVFEFWMGNGEDAGGGGVVVGDGVRRG
jgi:fluoride ion exporter CrcB/FEX